MSAPSVDRLLCPLCGEPGAQVGVANRGIVWAAHKVEGECSRGWKNHVWTVNEEEGALPIQLTMKGAL